MSESTLNSIKKSACKLFASKSYEGTSIRDIATDANVNVSAISYHFGSKEGLFLTLMKEIGTDKAKIPLAALTPPKTTEEMKLRLEMFFSVIIDISVEDPNSSQMFHAHLDKFAEMAPKDFEEAFLDVHTALIDFIRSAQKNRILNRKDDPAILCQIVFGSLFDLIGKMKAKKHFFNFDLTDKKFQKKYIETLIKALVKGASYEG